MKSKTLKLSTVVVMIAVAFIFLTPKNDKTNSSQKKHLKFLKEHRFNQTMQLSKEERKQLGLPPNKYFEQQYLLEMNPSTGRPEFEKKLALQEELNNNNFLKNVPGSDNNAWVERGPTNVPGRTRAMLFDPNDSSNERVFAGSVSGGLWVNDDITDQNSSWTRVGIPENLAVSSITVDPNNSNIMYLGTGESYVQGQVNGNGIWKSTDGGNSWTQIFGGPGGQPIFSVDSQVEINSPANIQAVINSLQAGFGPGIGSNITGNLVLVDDSSASPAEGCNTLTNGSAVAGNIAVIERGSCNFTVKVKNAQDQGAAAVLMINNVGGNPIVMGGTDPTVSIPSVMISQSDGEPILDALSSGNVNVTIESISTSLPVGVTLVPGIFHINDIIARNNGGTTEIYVAVADAIYQEAPGTLLGQGTEYGLYRSINGGTTFSRVNLPKTAFGNEYEPNDLEISSNNTIWISTTNSSSFGDGGGTILSSSNGTSFTVEQQISAGSRTEIAISSSDPDKIYVLAQRNPVSIIRTTDGFATTETLALPDDADNGIPANDFTRGQAFYDLMLAIDPSNDEIAYVGGIDTFRTVDGGSSWTQISKWSNNANLNTLNTPFVHADIHELIFRPGNSNQALIATDGGVYFASALSSAASSTTAISAISLDYNTTQFYWGAIGQDVSNDQFLGGTQDNGSPYMNLASSGTNSSIEASGGDGAYSFIDKDGEYFITAFPFNNFQRFNLPFAGRFSGVTIVDEQEGSFINPAELDDNLDILFTDGSTGTTNRISRFSNITTDNPVRTNLINNFIDRPLTAFKVSPYTTASTTLFAGTDSGRLIRIANANGTPSYSDISGPEFLGSISAINFGANENEIMVTFHNYGVNSIWFTEDGGTTWQNKEGDFPDIPVKAILMNPLLNDEVIIGTDLGVWRTGNFKATNPNWVQSQNGMQNVKVTSFDLRTSDNTVLASTYGRGLFTGQFTGQSLSVEDISSNDDRIQLYPIPSEGEIKINSTLDFGNANVRVFDLNGRKIYSESKNIFGTVELDLSSLPKGAYILNIESEQYAFNKKILLN